MRETLQATEVKHNLLSFALNSFYESSQLCLRGNENHLGANFF